MLRGDDLFKGISNQEEDVIGEISQLESHFKRLCKVKPELESDDLGANGLIKIDADMATNTALPLTLLLQNRFELIW